MNSINLQQQLASALAAGANTADIRVKIAAALAVERKQAEQAAHAEADLLAGQAERADLISERLVAEALAEIEKNDDQALAALDGGAWLADLSGLRRASASLAAKQVELEAIEESQIPVRQHLGQLRHRLDEKQIALSAIHARRAVGGEHADDAGAASLLLADSETLRNFIAQTETELDAGDPGELRRQLEWHQSDYQRVKRDLLVRVAGERLDRMTAMWLRVYSLQRESERKAGLSVGHPSGTWRAPLSFRTIVASH